jgi:hypothetical protein
MNIPHTYNRDTQRSYGNQEAYVCTCGKPLLHPIHPHHPIGARHGRCTCGAPIDAICHRVNGDKQ